MQHFCRSPLNLSLSSHFCAHRLSNTSAISVDASTRALALVRPLRHTLTTCSSPSRSLSSRRAKEVLCLPACHPPLLSTTSIGAVRIATPSTTFRPTPRLSGTESVVFVEVHRKSRTAPTSSKALRFLLPIRSTALIASLTGRTCPTSSSFIRSTTSARIRPSSPSGSPFPIQPNQSN